MAHDSVAHITLEWLFIGLLAWFIVPLVFSSLFGSLAQYEYDTSWTRTQFDPYAAADAGLANAIGRVGRGW